MPAFLFDFALAVSDYIKFNFPIERSGNGWVVVDKRGN